MPIKSRENLIGAWAFFGGIILAVVAGALSKPIGNDLYQVILGVLAVLGIVVAYFVSERDVQTFLLASVSLVIVSFAGIQGIVLESAIRGIPIANVVSAVLGALLVLFVPATIVVALKTVFSIAKN